MGDSGTSLGVGSRLVLIIEPEFGVWSCVTQSRNTPAPQQPTDEQLDADVYDSNEE